MRLSLLFFICCTLLACSAPHCAEAKARHFKWEVSNMFWSPDCEEKVLIGINGQFPGPTIRAKAGDTIVVELKNGLRTEGVVIHWHGIRQIGTPWADGTAAISQCAINPEETFTYQVVVDKPGTYFYHGHYGMQRAAGLYGPLIVDVADAVEPFKYDGELNLLLSDWYHESIYTQMVGLSSKPFRWIGELQHLSRSGHACSNYSIIYDATRAGVSPPPAFPVVAGRTDNIVTGLSDLTSVSLFDQTLQLGTASLFIALIKFVQGALDDQRKNIAMVLLILLLVIPALPNAATAQMPQSKAVADHSACTSDPNTPNPHRCVHHKNSTT